MNDVGIGILFYNEIENARKILEEIRCYKLDKIDFYFLDNGTNNIEFSQWLLNIQKANIKVFQVEQNLGFGGGAKYLMRNIPNDFRGYMPGNYKVRPESLMELNSLIGDTKKLEVFKATRSGRNLTDRLKTFAVGVTTSAYFRRNMMDSGGTPTIVKAELVKSFQEGPNDFSFEAYLLYTAHLLEFKIMRAPITYGVRIHGSSHWQTGIKSELRLLTRIMEQKSTWKKMIY